MYIIVLYVPHYNKEDNNSKENIIILGGGFAGIQVLKSSKKSLGTTKASTLL
jgi:hypothetical protein